MCTPLRKLLGILMLLAGLLVLGHGLAGGPRVLAQTDPKKIDPNTVSMEIQALQFLDHLQATPAQLQALAKLAGETVGKPRARKPAKVTDKFRKKLAELRDALGKRDQEEAQILTGELGELYTSEKPVLDATVDITDPARKRAPEVLKQLTPRQVALYLASVEAVLTDPVEGTIGVLEQSVKSTPAEWKDIRDGTAYEVGELVGGIDPAAARKVADKVGPILDKYHKLKEDELKKARPEIEKALHQLVDAAGPTEILRHFMERHLAMLLSNPQLAAAADVRLKKK